MSTKKSTKGKPDLKKIRYKQIEVYRIKTFLSKYSNTVTASHSQNTYALIWLTSGFAKHTIDFTNHRFTKDALVLIGNRQVHSFRNYKSAEGFVIFFSKEFLVTLKEDFKFLLQFKIFIRSSETSTTELDKAERIKAETILEFMLSEFKNKEPFGRTRILQYLLKSLLILFERSLHIESPIGKKRVDQDLTIFFQFREKLEENFIFSTKVRTYANLLNVSSKRLGDATNSVVGKAPGEVIKDRILLEAKRLLKYYNFSVKEISFRLGFQDASNFTKYFKKNTGMTPKHFRSPID